MRSLVIKVPLADVPEVNAALDAAGYGPNNISVPMRGDVMVEDVNQATHYGCHWWIDQELENVKAIVRHASRDATPIVDTDPESEGRQGFDLFDRQGGARQYLPMPADAAETLAAALSMVSASDRPYARVITLEGKPSLIMLREKDAIAIRQSGNFEPLRDFLQSAVASGDITSAAAKRIADFVRDNIGKVVPITELLPPKWVGKIISREQAIAAGYFGVDA